MLNERNRETEVVEAAIFDGGGKMVYRSIVGGRWTTDS